MRKREVLGQCPVCGEKLDVTRLTCKSCDTVIEGRFDVCKFCALGPEQRSFVDVFIKNRGSIKDVEKELGISYPTVRNRLDAVIVALGHKVDKDDDPDDAQPGAVAKRKDIVEALARGEISADEAVQQLKGR
ncbi:MAG: DUF2089 domain-containing protein [Clostridia bacterium]|nr:DUF2089 domain-containing protein [Clostridia bacterium]